MTARLCVLGSLNMDLVVRTPHLPARGETLLAGPFRTFAGGKGANQAVAAARLGAEVAMVGRVGDDAFGVELLAALEREGVEARHVRPLVDERTGVALISVEESGENTILVAPGANACLRPDALEPNGAIAREIGQASTLLLQLEVPVETVRVAVLCAREHDTRVVLNAAPAAPLPPELLESLDVLIVNRTEAALLSGRHADSPSDELAARLFEQGPRAVVLTLGAEGAAAVAGGERHVQDAFPVAARDAVAAGDAFTAALAVGLDEGLPLTAALRFACAAGALTTTREGAQSSLPRRAEVEALAAG